MPELALGTAKFGLNYGITNQSGQVSEQEVTLILQEAAQAGIRYLDTAQAYGSAETILGKVLPKTHSFKIVSKLPKQSFEPFNSASQKQWEQDFQLSLQRMKVKAIDGFLLHDSADLKRFDSHYLIDWLRSLKERKLVDRLGISIYERSDLEDLFLDWIQLIQLPFSIYDQRFIQDGTINNLLSKGITIQVRSVFLQGLLLINSEEWPTWISSSSRKHHKNLIQFVIDHQLSLLDFVLGYIIQQNNFDSIVIGVANKKELRDLITSFKKSHEFNFFRKNNMTQWSLNDPTLLDPRSWPR